MACVALCGGSCLDSQHLGSRGRQTSECLTSQWYIGRACQKQCVCISPCFYFFLHFFIFCVHMCVGTHIIVSEDNLQEWVLFYHMDFGDQNQFSKVPSVWAEVPRDLCPLSHPTSLSTLGFKCSSSFLKLHRDRCVLLFLLKHSFKVNNWLLSDYWKD